MENFGTVLFKDLDKGDLPSLKDSLAESKAVFVNMMDIEKEEPIDQLKSFQIFSPLIAIHCYAIPSMIDETLSKGFDAYLTIFNFSNDIEPVIERLCKTQ